MQSDTKPTEEDLQKYHGFTQDTIKSHYDDLAKKYDDVLLGVGYPDPYECAKLVRDLGVTTDSRILDMGSGTGLVGQHLKSFGYTKILGLDASSEMNTKAEEKRAYEELRELFLGKPESFPGDLHGKFEAITAAGVLAEGHLTGAVFDEMLLALKKGGYAIFTTREEYLEKLGYQTKIDELVESAKWEFVKKVDFTRYADGDIGRFKPTQVSVYAYQKL